MRPYTDRISTSVSRSTGPDPTVDAQCAMVRGVSFGACYAYSPSGRRASSKHSRLVRARLKAGDRQWLIRYALCVRQQIVLHPRFAGIFGKTPLLVPVPRCTCARVDSGSPAALLAESLQDIIAAGGIWPGLRRISAVPKSSVSAEGCRPTLRQHFESLEVDPIRLPPARILLVDDVITKGRTMLAAAMRLQTAFPQAEIRAFALLRTMSRSDDIAALIAPCCGVIRYRRGDAYRDP